MAGQGRGSRNLPLSSFSSFPARPLNEPLVADLGSNADKQRTDSAAGQKRCLPWGAIVGLIKTHGSVCTVTAPSPRHSLLFARHASPPFMPPWASSRSAADCELANHILSSATGLLRSWEAFRRRAARVLSAANVWFNAP